MRRLFWIVLLPLLGPACSGGVELSGDGAGEEDGSSSDAVDGTDVRDGPGELPVDVVDVAVDDGSTLDILFSPEHNEWNGNTSIQLRLRDLRAARD